MEKQQSAPPSPAREEDHISHQDDNSSSDSESIPANSNQDHDASETVTPTECIAHLKFLAALAHLQNSVRTTDGLFKINRPKKHNDLLEDETIKSRIEEKRWQVYVSRAVDRFTQWWLSLPTYKQPPTVMSLKRFEMDPLTLKEDARIVLTKDDLPPLGKTTTVALNHISYRIHSLVLCRCSHGLAFLYAQPSRLFRRLL